MAASADAPTGPEELTFVKCLGRGFFGEVWKAQELAENKRTFAVKKVRMSLILENRLSDQLKREIKILYALEHPRIIRLHFDFTDGKYMYLGMEFASGGSLFDLLNRAQKFSSEVSARYFLETCSALDYLHHLQEKVIHRDIKPENILIDGDDHIKLADFGWANLIQENKRDTFCGTLDYLPPEMILGTGHDESVDMWNMGVLLYEMTTGQSPFGSTSKETTCRLILAVDLRFKADYDSDAKDLITRLCRKTPSERPKVKAAMAHKFITKVMGGGVGTASASASAAADGMDGRPSLMAARLDRINQILEAKQQAEYKILESGRELEDTQQAIKKEQVSRATVEAQCAEMTAANAARDKELDELRRKASNLQGDVDKYNQGGSKSFFGWRSRGSAAGQSGGYSAGTA